MKSVGLRILTTGYERFAVDLDEVLGLKNDQFVVGGRYFTTVIRQYRLERSLLREDFECLNASHLNMHRN